MRGWHRWASEMVPVPSQSTMVVFHIEPQIGA
jgi:hypothetical protein